MIVESNPQSRQFFIDLPQTGLFSGIQSGTRTDKSFIILVQQPVLLSGKSYLTFLFLLMHISHPFIQILIQINIITMF